LIEVRQKGGSAQDPFRNIMTCKTFDVKFSYDIQFTFGSLTFTAGEDKNLWMLPPRPASCTDLWTSSMFPG
jgi:hypothetical protein